MARHGLAVLAVAAGLWLLLSGGDLASWLIGAPVIVAAAWSVRLLPVPDRVPFSPIAALRFLPFFVAESLRGGGDVASRVLASELRVQPGFESYPLRLRHVPARVMFVNAVSLLPGTLAADLSGDRVQVHVLDSTSDFRAELEDLERRIGRIYREVLQ